jgi:pimeloyl-ACP methyl ester carboxylesterase
VLACDPEVEAEFYRMGTAHDAWDRLDELTLPVVLLCGEGSTTHHGGYLERLAAAFGAEPELEVVAGASHFVVMERPDLVAAHAARLLAPSRAAETPR